MEQLQYGDAHLDPARPLHTLEPAEAQRKHCFTSEGDGAQGSNSTTPLQETVENGGKLDLFAFFGWLFVTVGQRCCEKCAEKGS